MGKGKDGRRLALLKKKADQSLQQRVVSGLGLSYHDYKVMSSSTRWRRWWHGRFGVVRNSDQQAASSNAAAQKGRHIGSRCNESTKLTKSQFSKLGSSKRGHLREVACTLATPPPTPHTSGPAPCSRTFRVLHVRAGSC